MSAADLSMSRMAGTFLEHRLEKHGMEQPWACRHQELSLTVSPTVHKCGGRQPDRHHYKIRAILTKPESSLPEKPLYQQAAELVLPNSLPCSHSSLSFACLVKHKATTVV